VEKDGSLAFLDILVIRSENMLEFDIYRKSTATTRFICNDSLHPHQHKMAAFNSMIHRLLSFPLSPERYKIEKTHIIEVAKINGYSAASIFKIIDKKRKQMEMNDMSTLFEAERKLKLEQKHNIFLTYHPTLSNKINQKMQKIGVNVIHKSSTKLSQHLGSTKDRIDNDKLNGIYLVQCSECEMAYIGQTCRPITERFKQHLSKFNNAHYDDSAVALHMHETGHNIDQSCLELLQHVPDRRRLNCAESINIRFFADTDVLLNRDCGPLESNLLKFAVLP
jgi:hypothetical protein